MTHFFGPPGISWWHIKAISSLVTLTQLALWLFAYITSVCVRIRHFTWHYCRAAFANFCNFVFSRLSGWLGFRSHVKIHAYRTCIYFAFPILQCCIMMQTDRKVFFCYFRFFSHTLFWINFWMPQLGYSTVRRTLFLARWTPNLTNINIFKPKLKAFTIHSDGFSLYTVTVSHYTQWRFLTIHSDGFSLYTVTVSYRWSLRCKCRAVCICASCITSPKDVRNMTLKYVI